MSKRYREVLQEVETHHSRARARAAAAVAVTDDGSVTPRSGDRVAGGAAGAGPGVGVGPGVGGGASRTEVATDLAATGDARGGVAMLVRLPATATGAISATPRPAASPDGDSNGPSSEPVDGRVAQSTSRSGRPGNGPADADQPLGFAWRGRHYDVTRILGHWREEEGWWRRPDGEPIRIEQSDLWRVEAVRGGDMARDRRGVYELSRRGVVWRLDRVWD